MLKFGLRKYRFRQLEGALLGLFQECRAEIPGVRALHFDTLYYPYLKEIRVHGFLYYDNTCESFNSVEDLHDRLNAMVVYHDILFQSFENVLK